MIYRTPISQADLARAANARRTRRAAARCRTICQDMKMRRDFNMLCAENDMAAPFPDAYFGVPGSKMSKTERRGMMKALERLARSWL